MSEIGAPEAFHSRAYQDEQWLLALGESTSARLRRVEAELGSALSALATARQERDEALAKRDGMTENGQWWCDEAKKARRELADAREEISKLQTRLAHAKGSESCAWRELSIDLLRDLNANSRGGQIYVAKGPAGTCVLCGGPIVRGQAVESVAGQTKPQLAHAACPDKEG